MKFSIAMFTSQDVFGSDIRQHEINSGGESKDKLSFLLSWKLIVALRRITQR